MSGRLIDTFSAITEEGALDWPGSGCLGPRLGAHPIPGPPLPLPADSGSSQVLPLHGSQEPTTHWAPARGCHLGHYHGGIGIDQHLILNG